jgi:hypothetical protein
VHLGKRLTFAEVQGLDRPGQARLARLALIGTAEYSQGEGGVTTLAEFHFLSTDLTEG